MKRESLPAMLPPSADTHVFILRIWQERAENCESQPAWRGWIEKVGLDRRVFFINYQGMLRFIQEQTGISVLPKRRWWQALLDWVNHEE
jgi:hypothetical protein